MKLLSKAIRKLVHVYKATFWSYEKRARNDGVSIGENCDIQDVIFGSEPYLIEIGDNVQLTSGTRIFTHGGAWVLRDKYPNMDFFGKVKIKNNVYIGNNTLIMPGISIGSDVIVAAGSVVTKSVPDRMIVAGNPARIICTIEDFERKMLGKNLDTKKLSKIQKKEYLLSLTDEFFIKK